MTRTNPPQIFISYSHKDKKWLERLQVFLRPLEREGIVERWDDTRIDPGGKWKAEIKKAIESSFAAVLLISADFLASDFIYTDELPPLLSSAKEKGLLILPVLVSSCGFAQTKGLSEFQAVTLKGELKPLIDMKTGEREALWYRVCETIKKALPPVTSAQAASLDAKLEYETIQKALPLSTKSVEELQQSNIVLSEGQVECEESLYEFDGAKITSDARLREGAILYRMTSPRFSGREDILTGIGSLFSLRQGRFNRIQQRTVYCSDNILLSIAENLYYLYRRTVDGITTRLPPAHLKSLMSSDRRLVAISVNEIDDLVYAEAKGTLSLYPLLSNNLLVHPDYIIGPLHDFSDALRRDSKRGVLYPSPRHSRGLCIALFHDETNMVRNDFYQRLDIHLQLIAEGQDFANPPRVPNPFTDIIDSNRGYYSFTNQKLFEMAQKIGAINPKEIPVSGIIDFIRRPYVNYPYDAVRSPLDLNQKSQCPLFLDDCPYIKQS